MRTKGVSSAPLLKEPFEQKQSEYFRKQKEIKDLHRKLKLVHFACPFKQTNLCAIVSFKL